MLNLRELSDLHFEFHADSGKEFIRGLNPRGADVLVLAGDITKMRIGFVNTLGLFRKQFPKTPIVWTHGNHEFHESDREAVIRASRNAVDKIQGLHWLDCGIVEIGGRRILGTPLWFALKPAPKHPLLLSTDEEWGRGIIRTVNEKGVEEKPYADFAAIENLHTWVYEENRRAIKFLTDNMREGDIVVTHFAPSQQSVTPKFKEALSNCWFVSDIEPLIEERKPALVIHGHTHNSFDYMIGPTRVVCNPLGYLSRGEWNRDFDDNFTVSV
jgi:Icc-related predicted phosphoesterase